MSDYLQSRVQYDEWLQGHLETLASAGKGACSATEAQRARQALERRYPVDDRGAVAELNQRGFDVPPWILEMLADGLKLRHIGGVRVWYPSDIDRVFNYCRSNEVDELLTGSARRRKARGISWAEEAAVNSELLA